MKVLADTFYIENGNIGIGTTEPRQLLDINNGQIILNNGNLGIGTDYAQQSLHVVGPSLLNGPITTSNNNIHVGIGSVYANGFYGSNAIINTIFAANVGIGTTYAKEALHIYGNMFTHGIITTCNLTVLGDTIIFDTVTSNTDQMVITNVGSGPALIVRQEGDEPVAEFYDNESGIALYVGNNGNIGIGTMLPLHKLSVYGDTFLNGPTTTNNNSIDAGTGTITASQFIGTASKVAYDLVPGQYILGSNYNGLTTQTWDINASSNNIPSTLVSRDSKGDIYTANVGINTSIATDALTVIGSSFLDGSINTNNNNINAGTGSITAQNFYGIATQVSQSLTPGAYILGNSYDGSTAETWIINASSNNLPSTLVSRDANNTIFISNVGIGTTDIIDALNVFGKSILNGFVTTCNNDLDIGSGTLYANTIQNNQLYSANVGIGTTANRDVLDVEGYARTMLGYKVGDREIINPNGNIAWSNLIFYPFVDAGTGISGGGNLTSNLTISVDSTVVRTVGAYTLTGAIGMTAGLNMNNTNITNVNNIAISDPGPTEGISWTGGNLWKIYESPDSGANVAGDLQFVTGSHQRKFTIYTTGDARIQQTLFTSNIIADSNITTPYLVVQQEALFQGPITTTCNINLSGSTLYATSVGIGTTFTNVPLRVDGTTVLNGFVTTCNNNLDIGTGTLTGSYFTGTANKVGQSLTPSHYIVGTDYDGSSAITWSIYGFSNVTPSSLVARDALGNTYFGNVGIGTAVATHTLTVEGTSIFNGYIDTLNNSINAGTGTVTAAIFAGTATNVSQTLNPGDYIVGSNYDGGAPRTWTVYARSNSIPNSLVARDASSGIYASNVGIGTDQAFEPLTVFGNSILNGSIYTCNNTIYVGSGSVYADNFYGTATQVSQSLTPGDYIVGNAYNGSNPETWTLYASSNILPSTIVARDEFSNLYAANVGIGTTSVQVAFEVYSTNSILLPKGTIIERPTGVKGYVRYNTELDQFEGYGAGNAWGSLGGVKSTDQQTYITAENDSNIRFYTGGQFQAILNSNGNLGIGTDNPIVSLHINRPDSILLPKGTTPERPEGITGLIRYNTDLDQFEGFGAGNAWGSLGGVKSTDQQTYISATNDSNILFYTAGQLRAIMNSNGNLGLGTENPIYPFYINNTTTSKVAYADVSIPNQLLEHPPTSLTSNSTAIINQAYGNGLYTVTASSVNSNMSEIYYALDETGLSWFSYSTIDSYYDANNNYVGSNSIVPGYYGEWIKLELPDSIIATTYSLFTTALAGVRHPQDYKLYGSEDDVNWTVLDSQTNITTNVGTYVVSFANTNSYKYYAIVINKNNGPYNNAVITEWKLYGTSSTTASGFLFTNSNIIHATILSERDNTLLSYSINVPDRTNRDTSRPGASIAINTETDGLFGDYENYSIKTYPKNTSNEIPALVINLNNQQTYLAGNVGIGSTQPTQKLDVIGNIRASGDILAANIQALNTTSNQQVVIHNLGTPPALKVIQSGSSNSAEFYNNDVLAVAIGSNYKLSVQGQSLFTGTIYAPYLKGTASNIEYPLIPDTNAYLYGSNYDGSSTVQWGVYGSITNTPNYLVSRDATGRIYISNVGIGTTVITDPLTLFGSSFLDGPINTNSNNIDAGTGSVTAQHFYGTATQVSQSLDPGTYILGASYTGSSNITWNINASTTAIANTLVARDNNADLYSQKVGINTTLTSHFLTVFGDTLLNGQITTNSNNLDAGTGSITAQYFYGTATQVSQSLDPGTYILGASYTGSSNITWNINASTSSIANTLVARDGNADLFSQKVGINTTVTSHFLTVFGDTLLNGSISTNSNNIDAGTGSVTAQNFYGTVTQVSQSLDPGTYILGASYTGSSNITWNINATSSNIPNTLVARDSSGKSYLNYVGIGTDYTTERLYIEGDVFANGTIRASNLVILGDTVILNTITSNTEQLIITNDGSGPALIVKQSGVQPIAEFYDQESGTALHIGNDGTVGIGTDLSIYKLTVQGDTLILGTLITSNNNIQVGTGSVTAANFYGTATQVSQSLDPGTYILGASYTGSSNITWNINASTSAIANTLVARDGNADLFSQKVGINTTVTSHYLTVFGDTLLNGQVSTNSNNVDVGTGSVTAQNFYGTATRVQSSITADTNAFLYGSNYDGSTTVEWGVYGSVSNISNYLVSRDTTGRIYISNVGIGTTVITDPLTVSGSSFLDGPINTNSNNIQVGTGSVTAQNFYGTATQVSQSLDPGTYILGASYTGSSNITWNINASTSTIANTLVARDGNADLFSQKVGINTTVTSHFLTVFGDTLLNGQVSTNSNNVDVGTGSVTAQNFYGTVTQVSQSLDPGTYILGASYTGSSNITWNINASTSATASTLVARDATGSIYGTNVGIGTTVARASLDVIGTIQTSNLTATSSIYSATQFLGNTGTVSLPSYSWLNDNDTGIFNPIANSIALSVGGSEKIRLISSGNVGIGTTDPLYSVHIQAPDALLIPKGVSAERPSGTSGLIRYNTELDRFEGYGTSWAPLGGGAGGSTITSDDGYTIVRVTDDGNTTFINDTIQNAILTGSGNLGIGTPTPVQKLHVSGNALVSDTLYTSNLVLYNSIQYDSLNPALMFEFEIKPTRYTEQINSVSGTSNFTVPVLGMFDIIPEHVHIYHNGFKLGYLNSNVSDYTISYSYSNSIPVYTVVDVTLKELVYNNSVIDIQVYPKTLSTQRIGMVVQNISYNYWNLSLTGGNSNIYWNSGNVGIGIATPSVSLHVNTTDAIIVPSGTTAERPGTAPGSIRYNTELNTFEGYSTTWGPIGGGGTAIETTGFTSISTSNDNYLRFTTSNTLRSVIDPSGNVGIGTDTPEEKLHVQGSALVTDTLYSSNIVFYNNIIFSQNNSGLNFNFAMQPTYYTEVISNSFGKSNFIVDVPGIFYVEPNNTQVFLNGHKLGYISSSSNDYFINTIQYSSNTSVDIQLRTAVFNTDVVDIVIHPQSFTSNQVGYFIQNLNSYWDKQTSPDRIYYTSGNVGIGTSSPSEKLDVFGNMKIAGDILPSACNVYNIGSTNLRFKDLYLSGTTIDLGGTLISADPATGQLVIATPSGAPVDISTNTVSASNINIINNTLITYNGNVGIGTATPRYKLEVNGSITPSFCNLYDLGAPNLRYNNLYLSSNGIDVESVKITSDSTSNTIIVPNIRVNNTDISEWIRVNKPIKKFIENINGGRYPYDSIVVVNYDDNILALGNNTGIRFGAQAPEAPGVILSLPNKERADKVYCNTRNLYAISFNSNLYGSGENSRGQVGLVAGSGVANVANLTLTAIPNCKKVGQSANINPYSAMFLTYNGTVYSAGENQYGQLGDGTQTDSGNTGPRLTLGPGNTYGNPTSNVLDVIGIGGYDGTNFPESYAALLSDRTVWCVGYGGLGQMGNNTTTAVNTTWKQVQINAGSLTYLSNVEQISGGGNYASSSFYAIDVSGFLWSWGFNSQGQLGTGNTTNQTRAFKVTTFGSNSVVDIYAANSDNVYCMVKLSNNTFWGCGYNGYGQLGLGNTTNQTTFQQITSLNDKNIDKIYVSIYHCFAINFNTNRIYAAGINQNGLLGLGNVTSPVTTFTEVMFNIRSPIVDILPNWSSGIGGYTLILTEDGHTYFTGQTRHGYANNPDRDISFFSKNTFCITGG